jgi:hypothetical protein
VEREKNRMKKKESEKREKERAFFKSFSLSLQI